GCRVPPGFPTRRSSDLDRGRLVEALLHEVLPEVEDRLLREHRVARARDLVFDREEPPDEGADGRREPDHERRGLARVERVGIAPDRKSTRLNSSHVKIS